MLRVCNCLSASLSLCVGVPLASVCVSGCLGNFLLCRGVDGVDWLSSSRVRSQLSLRCCVARGSEPILSLLCGDGSWKERGAEVPACLCCLEDSDLSW